MNFLFSRLDAGHEAQTRMDKDVAVMFHGRHCCFVWRGNQPENRGRAATGTPSLRQRAAAAGGAENQAAKCHCGQTLAYQVLTD